MIRDSSKRIFSVSVVLLSRCCFRVFSVKITEDCKIGFQGIMHRAELEIKRLKQQINKIYKMVRPETNFWPFEKPFKTF